MHCRFTRLLNIVILFFISRCSPLILSTVSIFFQFHSLTSNFRMQFSPFLIIIMYHRINRNCNHKFQLLFPFISESNACKVSCRSKSARSFNMNMNVRDGVNCNPDPRINDICMDGQCVVSIYSCY